MTTLIQIPTPHSRGVFLWASQKRGEGHTACYKRLSGVKMQFKTSFVRHILLVMKRFPSSRGLIPQTTFFQNNLYSLRLAPDLEEAHQPRGVVLELYDTSKCSPEFEAHWLTLSRSDASPLYLKVNRAWQPVTPEMPCSELAINILLAWPRGKEVSRPWCRFFSLSTPPTLGFSSSAMSGYLNRCLKCVFGDVFHRVSGFLV